MTDPSTLVQQHADAIIATLVDLLDAPEPRARLQAARLLLLWGWGRPGDRRQAQAHPAGGLSYAEQQRAVDLLLPHLRPAAESPIRAATSCPARHADTGPPKPESPAHTPPPAVAPSEPAASPLAAPVGANSSRGDADPMSRPVLPDRHSADWAFRRPLPPPAPMEPPWPFDPESLDPRKRWPPWR